VGRNNQQNDQLTLRIANKEDMWLHTQKIPGSHVIIRAQDGEISSTALSEAALLAAHYSQARNSSQVPVDFTRRSNVKKPSGAKPGFVVYTPHQTLYVTPDTEKINDISLRQVKKL
jgi:predicted ribosome quality control (RQC) complex YloA/Tae2 family protein